MIAVESWHYNINRILLLVCGLWPYENSRFRYVRAVLIFGILVFYIVDELVRLFGQGCGIRLALKIFSDILPVVICLMKFLAFLLNRRKVKQILGQICGEWNALTDSEEVEIAKKYGKLTRRMTTILLLYNSLGLIFSAVVIRFIPIVIGNFVETNTSLPGQNGILPGQIGEKYIYVFLAKFTALFVLVATVTMLLAYLRHVCTMLRISCYRIQHSIDEYVLHMPIRQQNRLICRKLISAVNIQRRAMELFETQPMSQREVLQLCLRKFGRTSIDSTIEPSTAFCETAPRKTLQTMLNLTDVNELILAVFYVLGHFIYIFVLNYGCQLVTDHNADIFRVLYEIEWYMAPVHVQKFILFLMLKSTKSYAIVIGGIYVASLEGFVTLTSTSVSYFMVIYSTQ